MNKALGSLRQPSFLLCAVILAFASGLKSCTIRKLGVYLTKLPLPLKIPLDRMEEKKLAPYRVVQKFKITNQDVLDSLGTRDYLQWELEDPEVPQDSPVRYGMLFVTYYTGDPDLVPHVPDECYVGGGNTRLSGETIRIDLPQEPDGRRNGLPDSIGYQAVLFSQAGQGPVPIEKQFYVQYLFKVNGQYGADRTETRMILGKNFFSKYSYFCKVEWNFYGTDFSGRIYPDRKQALEAGRKLLTAALAVLEQDHWPDWENANRSE